VNKVGEIKIVVSDKMEELISSTSERLGIKKTEYVKGLVVEDLKKGERNEN
jgi:hypothetical protein